MALSTEDRQRVQRGLMRYWSRIREATHGFDKADLLAAVAATDAWIEANQTSYNSALPAAFRTGATLAQKTLLFMAVAAARVSLAFLRRVMGEVD
jgi:hypothetical protein